MSQAGPNKSGVDEKGNNDIFCNEVAKQVIRTNTWECKTCKKRYDGRIKEKIPVNMHNTYQHRRCEILLNLKIKVEDIDS